MTELHLHLDGSLRPDTVLSLAKSQGLFISDEAIQTLIAPSECRDLNDYLKCFELPLRVLQTPEALSLAVMELCMDLYMEGVELAEIRFAPQLHTQSGMTQMDAACAAANGIKRASAELSGFRSALILCCMRGKDNISENLETVRISSELLGRGVCGLDIAGAEALYKTSGFKYIFDEAKALGVPFTIHAGEADGPESVKSALDFGAKRIGHGIRAIDDASLLQRVIDEKICLEVCPTSNVQTKAAASIEGHPIRALFDMGARVTVNSDNRTVSSTSLAAEINLLKTRLGFTPGEIRLMQEWAMEASFINQNSI